MRFGVKWGMGLLALATSWPSTLSAQAVCARVRIRLTQEAVMTRTVFKATLSLDNTGSAPLEELRVSLQGYRMEDGEQVAVPWAEFVRSFGLVGPEITSTTGFSTTDGSGTLGVDESFSSTWTFVPTRLAAPTAPERYWIGGEISHADPDNPGEYLFFPLLPGQIVVYPDPSLLVTYFMESEVQGDDPFTDDVVEPSVPYALGFMVRNQGWGAARDFRITSAQPEIIENEKGLAATFRILRSQVGINQGTPSLRLDLGTINPGGSVAGRWVMATNLEGKFVDFSASFKHDDELGGENTSLVDSVTIERLVRTVDPARLHATAVSGDDKPAFLVDSLLNGSRDGWPDRIVYTGSRPEGEVTTHALGLSAPGGWQSNTSEFVVTGTAIVDATLPNYYRMSLPDRPSGPITYALQGVELEEGGVVLPEPVPADAAFAFGNCWMSMKTVRNLSTGQRMGEENFVHVLAAAGQRPTRVFMTAAITPAELLIEPTFLDFGPQPANYELVPTRTFTVGNASTGNPLTISSATLVGHEGTTAFSWTRNPLADKPEGIVLGPGKKLTFAVGFNPPAEGVAHKAVARFETDDPEWPVAEVLLTGSGAAEIAAPGASWDSAVPIQCGQVAVPLGQGDEFSKEVAGLTTSLTDCARAGGVYGRWVAVTVEGGETVELAARDFSETPFASLALYDTASSSEPAICISTPPGSREAMIRYMNTSEQEKTLRLFVSSKGEANWEFFANCSPTSGNSTCGGAVALTCFSKLSGQLAAGYANDEPGACGGEMTSLWYYLDMTAADIEAGFYLYGPPGAFVELWQGSMCVTLTRQKYACIEPGQSRVAINHVSTKSDERFYIRIGSPSQTDNLSVFPRCDVGVYP